MSYAINIIFTIVSIMIHRYLTEPASSKSLKIPLAGEDNAAIERGDRSGGPQDDEEDEPDPSSPLGKLQQKLLRYMELESNDIKMSSA